MDHPPNHGENGCIRVLHKLADSLQGHVKKKSVHLDGGTTLTRRLQGLYRGHRVELLANDELILADVEASYGEFELLKINPRPARFSYGKPARTITTRDTKHLIFSIDGNLSPAQVELCESDVLGRLLDVINPSEGEQMNVSQRLVRVYLRRANMGRVTAVIDAIIDIMPHEKQPAALATFPEALRPLVPLLPKWAIDDDDERSRKLRRCTPSSRQKLVNTVIPLLPAIDNFLDNLGANPPQEACALGSLAQAALEAQSLLRR